MPLDFFFSTGMINAGIGARQVTSLLSTLNIKAPHHSTLKIREREVGKALEEVALVSVDEALLVRINTWILFTITMTIFMHF